MSTTFHSIAQLKTNVTFVLPMKMQNLMMKNVLSEDCNIHIKNKNLVGEAKNRDKAKSKVDDTLACAYFDLQ